MEKIIVLDCETTGIDVAKDQVIEVAIRFGLEDEARAEVWHVRPSIPIPPDISKIHGFTDELVAAFPFFGEVAEHIARAIEGNDVLVGYNPDFDKGILQAEFDRVGVKISWPKITVCPKRLWDIHIPPPKRTLVAAFAEFVDDDGYEGAHGALADINATARVLNAQRRLFGLMDKPWAELDPERETWVGASGHLKWKDSHKDAIIVTFGKFQNMDLSLVDDGYLNYIINKDFPTHVKDTCRQMQVIRKQKIPMPSAAIALWAKERFT
jgi:DNA polymerase-3 subunit epsilon